MCGVHVAKFREYGGLMTTLELALIAKLVYMHCLNKEDEKINK